MAEGRVAGKACIVTGAGSGIGRASAQRLAEEGGSVLCVDLSADSAQETAQLIDDAGGTAHAVAADVSDPAAVAAYTRECKDRFGSVDVVVNNAGVNLPGIFHEVSDDVVDRTFAVNAKGPLYGCRAAIPYMLEQGGGALVNISSVNGIVSEPYLAVYSAS